MLNWFDKMMGWNSRPEDSYPAPPPAEWSDPELKEMAMRAHRLFAAEGVRGTVGPYTKFGPEVLVGFHGSREAVLESLNRLELAREEAESFNQGVRNISAYRDGGPDDTSR